MATGMMNAQNSRELFMHYCFQFKIIHFPETRVKMLCNKYKITLGKWRRTLLVCAPFKHTQKNDFS